MGEDAHVQKEKALIKQEFLSELCRALSDYVI